MDLSAYIRHFPKILRVGTSLDALTGNVNPFILGYTVLCWGAVILTDLYTLDSRGSGMPVRAIYEVFLFSCSVAHIPFFLRRRRELSQLVCTLLEPFRKFEGYTIKSEIVKDYILWVNRFSAIYIFYHVLFLTCFLMVLSPLFTLLFFTEGAIVNDWPLPAGHIPFQTNSPFVYIVAYVITASAVVCAGLFHSSWHLAMIIASLHTKARLRMTADFLGTLSERAGLPEPMYSGVLMTSFDRIGHDCLVETVQSHMEIIQFVRMFNQCFGMTLLVLFQTSMIIVAVLVLQSVDRENYETHELLTGYNLALACLGLLGLFNYFGQTIIDESEKLHLAMYACDWYNRPKPFKTSLRIMITVGSRPLFLKVGGLYPLSMESYGSIMKAIYSYVNILLSLQKEKV
ncbi:Or2ap [Homalodisca vitripennis]|nr:Or2ap [Homalodisca vitripennis]